MTRRRGFQLAEMLVAIALASGPMLIAATLIRANVSGARFNQERTTARLVLMDLVEILVAEPIEMLRGMAQPGSEAQLNSVLTDRMALVPQAAQQQFEQEVGAFKGRFTCQLTENLASDAPGLAELTLQLDAPGGLTLKVNRLFRVQTR